MSERQITIAIDAMGGENSPFKVLKGAEIFQKRNQHARLVFFGNEDLIKDIINKQNINLKSINIVNSTEDVKDEDSPNIILRSRRDSSIYKGLEFVKNNRESGFVSAGNTAAIMILSRFIIGMIKGIDRPAICSLIPNEKNYSIMLDLGANVTVNASNLYQFALMGICYFNIFEKNKNPTLGILNIGTENNKGLEFLQEASNYISNSFLKKYFVGFIEPNNITKGNCDIIVSDGYTGNIMLKSAEGISNFISLNLKKIFTKSIKNKILYKLLEKDIVRLKDKTNPDKYNGALLIGLNRISIKSHGSASAYAFSYAIEQCYNSVYNDLNKKIINSFEGN